MNVNDLFYPDDSDEKYWEENDEVGYVEIDLVEGSSNASTTLMYNNDEWRLSMYSPYHVGYDVEIGRYEVVNILKELANTDIDSFDWNAQEWVYVE